MSNNLERCYGNKLLVEPCFHKSKSNRNPRPLKRKEIKAFFCHWVFDFAWQCKTELNLNAGQHFKLNIELSLRIQGRPKLIKFWFIQNVIVKFVFDWNLTQKNIWMRNIRRRLKYLGIKKFGASFNTPLFCYVFVISMLYWCTDTRTSIEMDATLDFDNYSLRGPIWA